MESNVQVAIRIRPKSMKETFQSEIIEHDSCSIKIIDSDKYIEGSFNSIFGQSSSQEQIFEFITSLIDSSDKGLNSTILAYGQTGSGKTFTMFGVDCDPGIIPRVFSYLFSNLPTNFTILTSMVQLYNEKIYDMLQDSKLENPLQIREDKIFGVYLVNLTEYVIQSPDEGLEILRKGEINRSTRSTVMSNTSSRSHMICQISIESTSPNSAGNLSKAKINLCDLAGSEKTNSIQKSGANNNALLKETISINRSLSSLERIISNLAGKKNSHIPYRDSKLTYLLKDSLNGNARICLIATVSPTSVNTNESIHTLRFAKAAKEIRLNAKINEFSVADNKLIQRLQKEIRYLKDCMKITKNSEDIHQRMWSLQEENERLKEKNAQVADLDKIMQENVKMKTQLKKIMEMTGDTFGIIDVEDKEIDELDKFCDRFKSAPSNRNMTPLIMSSNSINNKQIEVRIRQKNNSVERRITSLNKTLEEQEKEKKNIDPIALKNKRMKTLEEIEKFREQKAKIALEKYENMKNNEFELSKKIENIEGKLFSEGNMKKIKEIDSVRRILNKAEEEKEKALQDLAKIRIRRDSRSPLRAAVTQQIFLSKVN